MNVIQKLKGKRKQPTLLGKVRVASERRELLRGNIRFGWINEPHDFVYPVVYVLIRTPSWLPCVVFNGPDKGEVGLYLCRLNLINRLVLNGKELGDMRLRRFSLLVTKWQRSYRVQEA